MNALRVEIDRVAETTTFNEQKLLDGSFSGSKRIQVGSEIQSANQISITINAMNWASITQFSNASVGTASNSGMNVTSALTPSMLSVTGTYDELKSTVSVIKMALQTISTQRSDMGAVQNRLEHTINNLKNVVENTTAAESAIRDTDMASEMVKFSNNAILAQAGQAMLAQANQANQGVLALL
jgi:flagellin